MLTYRICKMTRTGILILVAGTICLFTAGLTFADDFRFPANSFGQLLLVPNQSTGGNNALLSAQKGGAFEPISEFNTDDRYRQFGAPVARLDILQEDDKGEQFVSTCTANLIAPDVLLTNYHCIPGSDKSIKTVRAIAVFDYLREDQAEAPTYEVELVPLDANSDMDFALLRVSGEPGNRFGYFKLRPQKAKANQSLFIIHHPAGMPKRLTRFRCKAYAPEPYAQLYFRHRCDTLGGSSGSLIFDLDFEVVALHNRGGLTQDSLTSFNSGISIFSLMENEKFAALVSGVLGDDIVVKTPTAPVLTPSQPPVQVASHNPLPESASAQCDTVALGRICASSMLSPQGSGKYNYRMRNLTRNDGMAWVEAQSGQGIGEWLVFDFGGEKTISNVVFRNGYTRTAKTYSNNSRVSVMTLEMSTGKRFRIGLRDTSDPQNYSLPEPVKVKWIKLTIDDVFAGRKYADTALSYIDFR